MKKEVERSTPYEKNHVKAGRLAGPIGSKQADNFPALKAQRYVSHDLSLAK